MSLGRCSGCGYSSASTKVNNHVMTCSAYAALYRQNPGRCLSPTAEYERYRTVEDSPEARAARRETRIQVILADMERQYAAQAVRWQRPKDILAD